MISTVTLFRVAACFLPMHSGEKNESQTTSVSKSHLSCATLFTNYQISISAGMYTKCSFKLCKQMHSGRQNSLIHRLRAASISATVA